MSETTRPPAPSQDFGRWVRDNFTDTAMSYNERANLLVRTESPDRDNGRYLVTRQRYGPVPRNRNPRIISEIVISMGQNQPTELEMIQFGEQVQPDNARDPGFLQINVNEADQYGRSISVNGRVEGRTFKIEYDSQGRIKRIKSTGPTGKEINQDFASQFTDEEREEISGNVIVRLPDLIEGVFTFSSSVRPFLRPEDVLRPPAIEDGKRIGVIDILGSLGSAPSLARDPSVDDAWRNFDWQKFLRMELTLKQAGILKPSRLQLPKAA